MQLVNAHFDPKNLPAVHIYSAQYCRDGILFCGPRQLALPEESR